ncbi:MAG: AAA family ATPase [Nitrospina sp.]|jgi:uncharacterized protein YhaN|nr:AAA family ATPase [Nitrospina sp.]
MHFIKIYLKAFGKFTDHSISMDTSDHRFHLICGLNEAGKTTILNSISDLLFGFGHRTKYDFIHDSSSLRIGAELENSSGQKISFYRKKGKKKTLFNLEETKNIPENSLNSFLTSINQEQFERLFGLSHERLRVGGKELLEDKGELGLSLFQAGAGISGLRKTLNALGDKAEELYKAGGKNPDVNKAISTYKEAKSKARDISLSTEDWFELNQKREQTENHIQSLQENVKDKLSQKNRLARIRQTLPNIALLEKNKSELNSLAHVPEIGTDIPSIRKNAQEILRTAKNNMSHVKEEILQLKNKISLISIDNTLFTMEQKIEDLNTRGHVIKQSLDDLLSLESDHEHIGSQITNVMKDAGFSLDPNQVGSFLPSQPKLSEIRDLIKQYDRFEGKLFEAEETYTNIQIDLENHKNRLELIGPLPNISLLDKAVNDVVQKGELEASLQETNNKILQMEDRTSNKARALILWSGTASDLGKLEIPSNETIDIFDAKFQNIKGKLEAEDNLIGKITESIETTQDTLESLQSSDALPTQEKIFKARDIRERAWKLLRKGYIDGDENVEINASKLIGNTPLPEGYEDLVRKADLLADNQYREAEKLSTIESLKKELGIQNSRLDQETQNKNELIAQLDLIIGKWQNQWHGLDSNCLSTKEMRSWLLKHGEILGLLEELSKLRETQSNIMSKIADCRESISKELISLNETGSAEGVNLQALIRKSQIILETKKEAHSEKKMIQESVHALNIKQEQARNKLYLLNKSLDEWKTTWSDCIKDLELSPKTTTVKMEEIVKIFEKVRNNLSAYDDKKFRISQINENFSSYEEEVESLVSQHNPDLPNGLKPVEAIRELFKQLQGARIKNKSLLDLEEDLGRNRRLNQKYTQTANTAEAELTTLCVRYKCSSPNDLETIETSAERKSFVKKEIGTLTTMILECGEGLSLDAIMAEAEAEDKDQLPGKIEPLSREIDQLNKEIIEASENLGKIKTDLQSMSGSDDAAKAAQEAEMALSNIREKFKDYMKLRLAQKLLNLAISKYQERNQGPILEQAGQLFADMTMGSFSGLSTEFDDNDIPFLVGTQSSGKFKKVEEMSDGTVDQLFLALRLASISFHLEGKESIPLILDDVLVNFDNERAGATLKVLFNLSSKFQILFFTHHPHLVTLAKGISTEYKFQLINLN